MKYESRSAVFSSDRKYRYVLWRWWNNKEPYAMFIGLNPSTADEIIDDPTIRRCVGFAADWGYGGLCMTNLFAFRAVNPKEMMKHPEPVGVVNDDWLLALSRQAGIVIAAWGTKGAFQNRDEAVYSMMIDLKCFGLTKGGHPRHPLYLPMDTELKPFYEKMPRLREIE